MAIRTSTALVALATVWASTASATEITYALWDANQMPAYQACAADFTKAHPDITIKVTQAAWNDYWSAITTGIVAGTAPDVFTNHLSRYPEFAAYDQILDIAPLIKRDGVPTDIYEPGLYDLWGRNGKQYGLPKDWDSISLVYNKDMLKAAGVDPAELSKATWNPKDGGTFEKLLAKLTLDKSGKAGDAAGFNAKEVKQFGLLLDYDDTTTGQRMWANFAAANGFKYNEGPWSTAYHYDDPRLAEAVQWFADLALKKGYGDTQQDAGKLGQDALFLSGKGAMVIDGSWMIKNYVDNAKFPVGFAVLPIGPNGRKTMFNGLADAIWAGTKHKEESWQWVKYLGSKECQTTIAKAGVVFPAVVGSSDIVREAVGKKGIDVSAFTEMAKPGQTFLFPITDKASEIKSILRPAFDYVFLGRSTAAEALGKANKDILALFQ